MGFDSRIPAILYLSTDGMITFAYCYTNPLLESVPDRTVWGQEVDRLYEDRGDRHQWALLLKDCQTRLPARLLVRRLVDLGDSIQEVGDRLAELEALGVRVESLEEELGDGAHQSDLMDVLRSLQQQQRSRQIRLGHARNRLKTLPPPGKAPYGYRRSKDRYVIDRATAPIVKAFFDHFLLYGSLRDSVRHLEAKHHKKISPSTGKRWLTSPIYRGDLEYSPGEIISDTHAPIVSRQEAAQIDRLLRRNRPLPRRSASAPRSLAGLVVCGECQSSMTITRVTAPGRDHEYLYLRPMQCPRRPKCRAIAYAEVLERTIAQICQELPAAIEQLSLPPVEGLRQAVAAQIAEKRSHLEHLPHLLRQGILDKETLERRSYTLKTEIAQLQEQLSQLPPVDLKATVRVVSIPQFWQDLSESERRFYLREFIRQIAIDRHDAGWNIRLVFLF